MKKFLLMVALLGGTIFCSQAQTEKSNFMVGGQFFYSSSTNNADDARRSSRTSIVPNVGYFVIENLAVGTGIGFESAEESYGISVERQESFVISPFGRYYVTLSEKFKLYGHAAIPMNFGKSKRDINTPSGAGELKNKSFGIQLSPGFVFFPSSKVGLEFALNGLSYSNLSVEDQIGDEDKYSSGETFSIGTNFFSPRVGIQFYF